MKNIILLLALLSSVFSFSQINSFSTSSGAFYVDESYSSTKNLSNEVAKDILFDVSKIKGQTYVKYEFILTNEKDNIYTGNLITHNENDFSILMLFPVSVVYDGSSVRWTIPPMIDWYYKPNNNITNPQKKHLQKKTTKNDYKLAKILAAKEYKKRLRNTTKTTKKEKVIEIAPIYPGCDSVNNSFLKKCMNTKITNLFKEKFNMKLARRLTGQQEVYISFKINTLGNVIDINAKGSNSKLEKEAKRVLSLLPKIKPGTQNGKAVIISFSLPIKFNF